ncbi:hypothetical protein SLS56_002301 [Neofusicoccum ribis]|uniref:Fumarylacetoacetase-like C-terminal domain-containing protein n=1 Tax=Neofusicoccum ribis TaxID=45134 RepID=A0ABR3T541_9PEZI
MAPQWTHLARFIAKEDGRVHLGQIDPAKVPDVGRAVFKGEQVAAHEVTGGVFDGVVTGRVLHVDRLLSPLAPSDVPLIRCMGINYHDHAKEANIPPPTEPILFIKPRTALNGPYPAAINVPTIAQDGTSDYEAKLTFVIGKEGRTSRRRRRLRFEHEGIGTLINEVYYE